MISLGAALPSSKFFSFERLDIKVPRPPYFTEDQTKELGIVQSAGKYDIAQGKSIYGKLLWVGVY